MGESLYCTKCGGARSETDKFCGNCGNEFNNRTKSNVESSKVLHSPKEIEYNQIHEGEQEDALLMAFVGERKQSYYHKKWKEGNKQSLNWAAFFGSFFWLSYRKMYKVIIYILLIFFALDLVILLTGINGDPINRYIGYGLAGVLGAGGNSMYKNYAQKKIKKLKTEYSDDVLVEKVKQSGGGSWKGVWIGVVLLVSYIAISLTLKTLIPPKNASVTTESELINLYEDKNKEIDDEFIDSVNKLNVSLYFPQIGLQRTYIQYAVEGEDLIANDEVVSEVDSNGKESIYIYEKGGIFNEILSQYEISDEEISLVYITNLLKSQEVNELKIANRIKWKTGDADNTIKHMTGINLKVEVPAGVFDECIEVTQYESGQSKNVKYYAPNIGLIKTVFILSEDEEYVFSELQSSNLEAFTQRKEKAEFVKDKKKEEAVLGNINNKTSELSLNDYALRLNDITLEQFG